MNRHAIARGRRRAQAAEALEFERERERALTEQIEMLVLETEGAAVDAEAFARLDAADVALVREALGGGWLEGEEDDEDEGEDGFPGDDEPDDGAEEEIARLLDEIERSRSMQAALERYVAALGSSQS